MANTSSRTLRLLSLLQTHRFWPGIELAGRLEVSERTLRRDIERLRDLGYPVVSSRGAEGGYQLSNGGAMPPLVIDDDEAIAVVVALTGASNSASGALSDATLSALGKVVQVLPPRLRKRAEALRSATVDSPFGSAPEMDATVLAALSLAIRDSERMRFDYTARGGAFPGATTNRHVEPHQLVTVGRRWYLVGYDLDRADWRSFRLDRIAGPAGTRSPFRRREIPGGDAAQFVRDGLSSGETGHAAVARVRASAAEVQQQIGQWVSVEETGTDECVIRLEARDPRWMLMCLQAAGAPFVLESATPGIIDAAEDWASRLGAALAARPLPAT